MTWVTTCCALRHQPSIWCAMRYTALDSRLPLHTTRGAEMPKILTIPRRISTGSMRQLWLFLREPQREWRNTRQGPAFRPE